MSIEFTPNYRKIVEAILYVLSKHAQQAKSIFILKCLYYADKYHLQQYATPITGDLFVKLKHGPCATNAYNIMQGNELYIPEEILDIAKDSFYSFDSSGTGNNDITYKLRRPPNTSLFSDTNLECLDKAIDFCASFNNDYTLSEESHKEQSWINAVFQGPMSYELMIDDCVENKNEIIEYLEEHSRALCL